MAFSQLSFIFIFLPVFLVIYCILPKQFRGLWMMIASLGFYFYGTMSHPEFILLLVLSVVINYLAGRFISGERRGRKAVFVLAVIYNFSWLVVFKYLGFIISNVASVTGLKLTAPDLLLPLGISFYTFQSVSYLADVYKRKTEGAKSLLDMAVFILMFPKLTSGPIARYPELKKSWDSAPEPSLAGVNRGFLTFTLGLGMKVILADRIGTVWSGAVNIGFDSISTPLAWLAMVAYAMQLYFDFAGYSLMAVGIGEMLGFSLPENFDDPYTAKSVSEFWRRWHITLGAWFRDYIYIPLGGSRKGLARTVFNLLVVWLFTGLWHGASWSFVVWGLYLFFFIAVEKLFLKKALDKVPFIAHVYLVVVILFSWLFFAVGDISQIPVYIMRLFGVVPREANIFAGDYATFGTLTYVLMGVGLFFCTGIPTKLFRKHREKAWMSVIMLAIFWYSIYTLYHSAGDPFMYFNF